MAVDKEQVDIMKNLAPLMERMAVAAEKIEKAQGMQIDLVRQLGTAMNAAGTKEFISSLTQISKSTKEIVEGMKTLNATAGDAISNMTKEASKASTSFNEFEESIRGASEAALELGRSSITDSLEDIRDSVDDADRSTKSFTLSSKDLEKKHKKDLPAAVGATSAAVTGLSAIFKGVISIIGSVIRSAFKLIGALFKVARGIVGLPFTILEGIVNMANKAASGSSEWAEAIRELKMEYGALTQAAPAAIMKMAKDTKGLSQTGLNAYAVFGTVAERMKEFNKLGQEMGAVFENFTDEFAENGAALVNWQKGLGLSGEQMGNIARYAQTMGTSMKEEFLDMQKQVYALSEASGIATKHIARDYAKAIADAKTWGGATRAQIQQSIVYIRRLGVEIEKVAGIMETFSTFEGAAEAASKLSQAFGVALDPLAAVSAQDPTAVIEDLRKQFAAGGVDVSKFDRASKRLLATTVGLDEATAQQIFSLENQGMSLDEIRKKSEQAEKKQLSQAEAMKQLADSIELLVRSGSREGGFFSQFIKGFSLGIERSREFRKMIWNVSRALRETFHQGIRLGRAFAESFPGVKKFFGGIADFFNPTRFRRFIRGVTDELILLVKGKKSFPAVMDEIRTRFFSFWDITSGPGKKILGGAKDFLKAIARIAGGMLEWIAKSIGNLIQDIVDLATGEKKLDFSGVKGAGGVFMDIIDPIIKSISNVGEILGPPIEAAYVTLKEKAVKYFKETIVPAFEEMAGPLANALFGPVFVRAVLGALAYVVASAAISGIGSFIKNKLFSGKAGPIDPAAAGKASGFSMGSAMKLALGLGALAALVYIGVIPLAERLKEVAVVLDKTDPDDLLKAMGVAGLIIVSAVTMAGAAYLLSKADPASLTKGAVVLSILTLVIAGVSAIVLGILEFGNASKLEAAGKFMVSMTEVFIMMGPLALAAMGLAAILAGTLGFGAVAILAGIGMMGAMMAKIAREAVCIMEILAGLPTSPQFKEKFDMFTTILKLINEFASIMLKLVEAAKPKFEQLKKKENTETFVGNLNKMIEFVNTLVGKKSPPTGIIGIIETVKEAIKEIGKDPDFVKAAPIFQGVLEGVAAVLKAMTPPPELIAAQSGFWNAVGDLFRSDADEAGQQTAKYIKDMQCYAIPIMQTLTTMVTEILKQAGTMPDEKKAMQAGAIIGSITGLVQAVMPSKEVMAALSKTMKQTTVITSGTDIRAIEAGLADTATQTTSMAFDATAAAEFFGMFITQVKPLIERLTGGLLDELIQISGKMTSAQIEKLKLFVDVFNSFTGIVKAINEGIVAANKMPDIEIGSITSALGGSSIEVNIEKNANNSIKYLDIISDLGKSFGVVMSAIQTAVQNIPTDYNFKNQLDRAKTMFEMLEKLPSMAQAFKDVPPIEGSGYGVLEGIRTVLTFLGVITDPTQNNGVSVLQELGLHIININRDITKSISGTSASAVIEKVLKFVDNITKLVTALKGITEATQDLDPTKTRSSFKTIAAVISSISSKEGLQSLAPAGDLSFGVFEDAIVKEESSPLAKIADSFKAEDLNKLSGIVSNIETFAKRMGRVRTALEENKIGDAVTQLGELKTSMATFRDTFKDGLNLSLGISFGDKLVPGNITVQEDMNATVTKLITTVKGINRLAQKGVLDMDISALPQMIETMSTDLGKVADAIDSGLMGHLSTIYEMTSIAKSLGDALKTLPNLKLDAKLKAFAGGIGGKFNQKIETSKVNINLDVAVMIDAQQLEASIIYRKMSVLRDRINTLATSMSSGNPFVDEIKDTPRMPAAVPGANASIH